MTDEGPEPVQDLLRVGDTALKTASECSFTVVNSASSAVFALSRSSSRNPEWALRPWCNGPRGLRRVKRLLSESCVMRTQAFLTFLSRNDWAGDQQVAHFFACRSGGGELFFLWGRIHSLRTA
ncbi:hypothetical protein E8F11_17890 [Pseudomonas sp. BN417]|nr:hypothetical protein [Pseudomonas sp. BN417]